MCGIAGALVYGDAPRHLLIEAIRECRKRGENSFGLLRWSPASRWFELRRLSGSAEEFAYCVAGGTTPCFFLHTSRAEPTTEYTRSKTEADIPPFRTDSIAVAHNGIIANDRDLASRYEICPGSAIDTAIMPELISRIGFWKALAEIRGGCAFGVVDTSRMSLFLARNFLPLTIVSQPGIVIFASERSFFKEANDPFPPYRIWDLPAYTAIEISPAGYRNPVAWGDVPTTASNHAWKPFPVF